MIDDQKFFILACGLGGCFNGYTDATIVKCYENDCLLEAYVFAENQFPESENKNSSLSFSAFDAGYEKPMLNFNGFCGGRLKPSAIRMLELEI